MYITTKAAIPTNDGMAACVFYLHSIFRKSKIFPNLRCRLLSASHHGWQEGYEREEAECQSADGADGEGEPEGLVVGTVEEEGYHAEDGGEDGEEDGHYLVVEGSEVMAGVAVLADDVYAGIDRQTA